MNIPEIAAPAKGDNPLVAGNFADLEDEADDGFRIQDAEANRSTSVHAAGIAGPEHNTLDAALSLAQRGFRVFPLQPGKKLPVLDADWRRIATTDPAIIRGWWTCGLTGWIQPYNIGIATGDGLVVIDVDVKDGKPLAERLAALAEKYGPLPDTYAVDTPSGGRHYYFKTNGPAPNSVAKLLPSVDTRGDKGFVVAEGSKIGKNLYRQTEGGGQVEPAQLPESFAAAIRSLRDERAKPDNSSNKDAKSRTAIQPDQLDSPQAVERAIDFFKHVRPALEGEGGDKHTFAVAAKAKDMGLTPQTVHRLMLDHFNERCEPPWTSDDLMVKVRNAFNHGQNPIGAKAPEAEFEPVEVADRRAKVERPRLHYLKPSQIEVDRAPRFLIEDWFDLEAMIVTYGESNSGKTHTVLAQSIAIATGTPWAGRKVHSGLVCYIAAEGGRGIKRRVRGWCKDLGRDDLPFALIPCPIDLLRPAGDTKALIALVKDAEKDFGQKCVMVVIDTLSRALAGGNENAPDDMGAIVRHCDQIRAATGAAVHIIHHSGKNQAAGARGHSLLRGATDTEIEVTPGEVKCTKQRDLEGSRNVKFALRKVALGTDTEGKPIETAIPDFDTAAEFGEAPKTEPKITLEQSRALKALAQASAAENHSGIAYSLWAKKYGECRAHDGKKKLKSPSTFKKAIKALVGGGLVEKTPSGAYRISTKGQLGHSGPIEGQWPKDIRARPGHPPYKGWPGGPIPNSGSSSRAAAASSPRKAPPPLAEAFQ